MSPFNSSSFSWSQVALHQVWYVATATISSYTTNSLSFFVRESTNIQCLSSSSTSTTSTSPDSSNTTFPVFNTSSSINKGAIAGGVVGGAALLIGVLALYYFLRSRRPAHHPPSSSSYSGGAGPAFGMSRKGWDGLSSVDSTRGTPTYAKSPAPQRKRSKLRSSKPYPNGRGNARQYPQSDLQGTPMVNRPSDEEIQSRRSASAFSQSEEKFGSAEEVVGMATLPANGGKRQSSLTDSLYHEFGYSGSPAATRRRSVGSTLSLPPGARHPSMDLYSPAYPSPTAISPTPSASHLPSSFSSSVIGAVAPAMDHSDSASSQLEPQKKKTPRKPVPAYDPSSSPPLPTIDRNPSTSTLTPPSPFVAETEVRAQRRSSAHYSVRSFGEPQLNHKSSFGPGGVEGRPLHYLIPDMPPAPPS